MELFREGGRAVLEIRSTKSKCQHGRLHPEVSLLDLQAATTLLCAHMTSFLTKFRDLPGGPVVKTAMFPVQRAWV